jgi:hypothetical protein
MRLWNLARTELYDGEGKLALSSREERIVAAAVAEDAITLLSGPIDAYI